MPLEIHIHSIDLSNMEARMQAMARPTYAALSNYVADGKPAVLFVPTRRHARMTALDMLTFAAADGKPHRFLQVGIRGLNGREVLSKHHTSCRCLYIPISWFACRAFSCGQASTSRTGRIGAAVMQAG